MAGNWQTITLPATLSSGGAFSGDLMLLLTDGSLFVHNAYGKEWLRFKPDSTGGYSGPTWSTVFTESEMANTREYFASGILKDGRVFAIGGEDSDAGSDTPLAEIFDPQTNSWSKVNKPAAFDFICGDCNGAVLSDGRVLLLAPNSLAFPLSKRTAIWDPHHNTWEEAGLEFGAAPSTTKKDPCMEETFTLLPDGSVLVPDVQDTPKAQRYIPSLDKWEDCKASPVHLAITFLSGVEVMETGPTILLPDGDAFCIGGTGETAIFKPGHHPTSHGNWHKGPVFPADTSMAPNWPTLTALDAPACLMPNGRVILMGGTTTPDSGDYFSLNPVFLEYDPNSGATTLPQLDVQPPLPGGTWTWQCNFLLLPTGQLLCSNHNDNDLLLYTPDPAISAPHHSWRPAHISVPNEMMPGHTYRLYGTQLNGLSQAVSYGDDGGMATNYPIVRISHVSSGETVYLRSHHFSTMGVSTGDRDPEDLKHCAIDIPASIPIGHWHLVAIANGIESRPVDIEIVKFIHHDGHDFVGKIESLTYDHFGDFKSFTLQTNDGDFRQFESREPHMEDLVKRAWQDHLRVKVHTEPQAEDHPASVSLVH
jgi:hypothetical protein